MSLGVQQTRGSASRGDPRRRVSRKGGLPPWKRSYAGGGALHLALAGDAPVCTRSATRGGKDCSGAVCPRGGRLLVGEAGEGVLPGGDHTAGVARGWGGDRWHAGSLGAGGTRTPADVGRGLPSLEAGGCRWITLGGEGGAGPCLGARQLGGGAGTARRGGRVSRRGARARGRPHVWEPAERRRARGPGLPEAAARGRLAPAGDAGGSRSRGPSGRSARGSERSFPGGGRRSCFRGDPAPPPAAEAEARAWAARGCTRGAPRPRVTQPRPPPGAGTRPGPAVGS